MVLSTGWRCLRATGHAIRTVPTYASFSTSTVRLTKSTKPAVKGMSRTQQMTQQRAGFKNKGGVQEKPKAPFKPGERKKLRNTIVLSNTNAPKIEAPALDVETSLDESAIGALYSFEDTDIDKLRILDAFRRTQDWKFFHRPSTIFRSESLLVAEKLARISGEQVPERESEKQNDPFQRMVVYGPKGSGKSILMLQTIALALQRNWVVINIPNAHDLVIGHTEYELDTESGLWKQPVYTSQLLQRIAEANRPILQLMTTDKSYKFGKIEIEAGAPLTNLTGIGSKDSTVSHECFMALLEQLERPESPPVLFTFDVLNEVMQFSEYRDPDFKLIHAHDLAIPNVFLAYLSGKRKFPKGLIMGATSASGAPRCEALELALVGEPLPNFSKLDQRVAPSLKGSERLPLGAMDITEARSLLEYCRSSGLLRSQVELSDEKVVQAYALSSGLPKELVAGCVRLRA
ncbi:mitochondrial ribosomal death-associated protein 3-domain-containing protein [Pyronema omphalodes]|nr:mitochondrial ribosomal death-associated protein 3-domain-containing protein [Pyronema omphalodes]